MWGKTVFPHTYPVNFTHIKARCGGNIGRDTNDVQGAKHGLERSLIDGDGLDGLRKAGQVFVTVHNTNQHTATQFVAVESDAHPVEYVTVP